jgi:hypothetical protein
MPQRWNERLAVFRCTLFFGVGVLANRCSKRNLCATAFIVVSLAFVNDCGYKRSVKDFGAIGNGTADDRRAIQATIDDVAAQGGGVVGMTGVPFRFDCPPELTEITLTA